MISKTIPEFPDAQYQRAGTAGLMDQAAFDPG
jgi:hypothetical protein